VIVVPIWPIRENHWLLKHRDYAPEERILAKNGFTNFFFLQIQSNFLHLVQHSNHQMQQLHRVVSGSNYNNNKKSIISILSLCFLFSHTTMTCWNKIDKCCRSTTSLSDDEYATNEKISKENKSIPIISFAIFFSFYIDIFLRYFLDRVKLTPFWLLLNVPIQFDS